MISKRWELDFRKAVALQESGQWAKAEAAYVKLCELAPYHFDIFHLCGTASLKLGHYKEAIEKLARAFSLNQKSTLCGVRLGVAYNNAGNLHEAEAVLRATLTVDPLFSPTLIELGKVLWKLGKLDEAEKILIQATTVNKPLAEAYETLGALITVKQGYGPSEVYFREAVKLDPNRSRSWFYLGVCRYYMGYIGEALTHLANSINLDGKFAQAHAAFGLALEKCFRLNHAYEAYLTAIQLQPTNTEVRSSMLLLMQYLGRPRSELDLAHREFGNLFNPEEALKVKFNYSRDISRKIKLAFISPDFRTHAVSVFMEPILQSLDKAKFEIFLYHDLVIVDETTERLKHLADKYTNFTGLQNDFVIKKIKEDEIDVLVDLAGHTGYNRLPMFAKRVAPVQISYLGYPDTTGLAAMDYRFVDSITDPQEDTLNFYSEKRVRFSTCAWSYLPPKAAGELKVQTQGPITFACINNYSKVTDFMLSLWALLLEVVPESRLVIKGEHFSDPLIKNRLTERLIKLKIPVERVDTWDRTVGFEEYFESFSKIDIALDTFPYNGTTTTCDTLWMGVPVITLAGDRHINRVGQSLLTAVGHPMWVAKTPQDYVALAAEVARGLDRSLDKRKQLRDKVRKSLLCNYSTQGANFGQSVQEVWQTWCRSGE